MTNPAQVGSTRKEAAALATPTAVNKPASWRFLAAEDMADSVRRVPLAASVVSDRARLTRPAVVARTQTPSVRKPRLECQLNTGAEHTPTRPLEVSRNLARVGGLPS